MITVLKCSNELFVFGMSEICFHYTSGILMETVWLTFAKCHYLGTGSVLPLTENVEGTDGVQPTYTGTLASE
jgi:hypothetical protein